MTDSTEKEVTIETTPALEAVADAKVAEIVAEAAPAAPATPAPVADNRPARSERGGRGGRGGTGGRGGRPGSRPREARKTEYDQKMINIRRVARVVSGGRRFSFSVAIIIGNKKGKVGVGLGKAGDTSLAIDKAVRNAKKNMITVPLTKDSSIAHDVEAKYNASRVILIPAHGRGLVAGSSARLVLELAGVSNIIAKMHSGSKNGLNNARATISALQKLKA
ncbi:MAG: 30S ribosomal protein S5 [Patescibacteria group bacterium]